MHRVRDLTALLAILVPAALAPAQRPQPVTGDRLTGFVLPILPLEADIRLEALRAWGWSIEDTKRLVLEGEVTIEIGAYRVRGASATVWINRITTDDGPINQIAAYFERADQPANRAGLGVSGKHLLLTGSAVGSVDLNVALLRRQPPPRSRLLSEGERRLAGYLRGLLAEPPPGLSNLPQTEADRREPTRAPRPGEPLVPEPEPIRPDVAAPPGRPAEPPLFDPEGTVWFSWQDLRVTTGEQENVVTAMGPIVVQYLTDRGDQRWSQLTLTAERAVVFTDPGPIEDILTGRMPAGSVRGIYLEGNVIASADKGDYTLRAPKIYYDFLTNQAIVTEAVLRTYDRQHRVPIYARAKEMRQIAANQWTAGQAKVSTSEFFTPHFAIGARRVTVTERPGSDGETGGSEDSTVHIDARDITLDFGGVPLLYWPSLSGSVQDIPLRSIEVGGRESLGVVVETTWNAFTLLGMEPPPGWDAEIRADGYTDRGPGGGVRFRYDRDRMRGELDLYYLHDDGIDRSSAGRDVEPSASNRGYALWEHQARFGRWTLQGQGAYISDATYINSWRPRDFEDRREYETSGYLKYVKNHEALTLLGKYNINDFLSNGWLLASREYTVNKLPEVSYRRYGDSLFGDRITYSSETRAGRVRLAFQESTPAELGLPGAAFGIPPGVPIDDALRASGLNQDWVARFDTRHEVAMPMAVGPLKVVPFVVGRITAYNEDFEAFSGLDDQVRAFGAVGVRLNTRLQRVDNTVESRLFDLHRLRHIIEPRFLAWYGATNIDDGDLPVYDEAVESIGGGSVLQVGVRNTWQTQRGGPGRWRSVDVLTVDASYVHNSNDAVIESPIPRFYEYRPEYSRFGDHVRGSAVWLLSDSFSIAGEGLYDLDNDVFIMGSVGTELRHSPLLSTFVEYRYIEPGDDELLEVGWNYELTSKYRVSFRPQWDFDTNDLRAIRLIVTRRFPDFDITFEIRRDEISNETTVGASMDLVQF